MMRTTAEPGHSGVVTAAYPFLGRWVLANALGETVGLGGTTLIAGATFWLLERSGGGPAAQIVGALACVLAGALVEGGTVGWAQWAVLRRAALPDLGRWEWVRATVFGAGAAWALGMVPSTAIGLLAPESGAAAATAQAPPGLDGPLIYLLAALMGLVLGPILAAFQARALRPHLPGGVGWWVGANALAWALGMPVIFVATELVGPGTPPALLALIVPLALFAAGAVVGLVHGCALAGRLLRNPRAGRGT
jgi:hypothetical protein